MRNLGGSLFGTINMAWSNASRGKITKPMLQEFWENGFKFILYDKKNNIVIRRYRTLDKMSEAVRAKNLNNALGIIFLANQNIY